MSDGEGVPAEARAVAVEFAAGRAPQGLERLGRGHIHVTLHARFADGPDLVLQRLNEQVFPDLDAVVHNFEIVTEHLRAAQVPGTADTAPDEDIDRRVLRGVRTRAGALLLRDAGGAAWRACLYVPGTRVHEVVESDEVAERGAHAFGAFAARLADLDPGALRETIPGFHDTPARLAALDAALERDALGRAGAVRPLCERALRLGEEILALLPRPGSSGLPRRVVHNDCKINNLLFDEASGQPVCVLDLDTVMGGCLLYDFGHLVRSAGTGAPEDEEDEARLRVRPERFKALARGYLAGLSSALAVAGEAELDSLALAGPLMSLEDAARFMADHLEGDRYFPAHREGHNRIRGGAQLALAEGLWAARGEHARIVRRERASPR